MTERVTMAALAGYLGISQQAVLQLTQKGTITRDPEDKLIDLRQGVQQYIENLKNQSNGIVEDGDKKFKSYAERDNYYKSEQRRIELLEKTGELYPREIVEESYYKLIELTREALLMLPDILERDADLQRKQVDTVQNFVDKKLQSLAVEVESIGADLERAQNDNSEE